MATTQYIGARYVPMFSDPLDWDSTKAYEPLTIVYYLGNSYTSRQSVPTGIDIANTDFWALTGNYNAQIEAYRKEVQTYDGRITANAQAIADEVARAVAEETAIKELIAAETARAEAAEAKVSADAKAAVESEAARAKTAESELATGVSNAITRVAEESAVREKADEEIRTQIEAIENISSNAFEIPHAKIVARRAYDYASNTGENLGEGCTLLKIGGADYYALQVETTKIALFLNKTLASTIDLSGQLNEINALTSYNNMLYVTTLGLTNLILTFSTATSYTVESVTIPSSIVPSGGTVAGFSYYDADNYALAFAAGGAYSFAIAPKSLSKATTIKTYAYGSTAGHVFQGAGYYAGDKLWYFSFSNPNFCLVWDERLDQTAKYTFKNVYSLAWLDELEDVYLVDGKIGFCTKGLYGQLSAIQNPLIPTVWEYDKADELLSGDLVLNRPNLELLIQIDANEDGYNDRNSYGAINIKYPVDALAIAETYPLARLQIKLLQDTTDVIIAVPQRVNRINLAGHYCGGLFAANCICNVESPDGVCANTGKWKLKYDSNTVFMLAYDIMGVFTGGAWPAASSTTKAGYLSRCSLVTNSSIGADRFYTNVSAIVGHY